jgi:hypothetical protein
MGGPIVPELNIAGLIRGAIVSMPVGLVLLVGGIVAIATGTTTVGAVLLVLAVLSVCVGCLLMLKVRSRAGAVSRDAQARWQAQVDASRDDRA